MSSPVVVQAGIPALGTMLVIAAIALVLGLIALWLSRRHTRRGAAEWAAKEHGAAGRAAGQGSAVDPAAPPTQRRPGPRV